MKPNKNNNERLNIDFSFLDKADINTKSTEGFNSTVAPPKDNTLVWLVGTVICSTIFCVIGYIYNIIR